MIFLAIATPPLLRDGDPLIQAEDIDAARAVVADWRGEEAAKEVALVPQMEETEK